MRHEQFYNASGRSSNTKLHIWCNCAGSAGIALIFRGRWGGNEQDSWPRLPKGVLATKWHHGQCKIEGWQVGGTCCLGELIVCGESLGPGVLFDFSRMDSVVQSCFEHKVGSGSLLFWDQRYRISAHDHCQWDRYTGAGWALVLLHGEQLHCVPLILYILTLLLSLLLIYSFLLFC